MRQRKMTDKEWLFLLYGFVKSQATANDQVMLHQLEDHLFPETFKVQSNNMTPHFGDEPTNNNPEKMGMA